MKKEELFEMYVKRFYNDMCDMFIVEQMPIDEINKFFLEAIDYQRAKAKINKDKINKNDICALAIRKAQIRFCKAVKCEIAY